MRLALASIAALAALTGCGAGTFVASPADYAAYRATRVGATFEQRLGAADRYLTERRDGAFRADVQAYFDLAEPAFYASKRGSIAGLDDYLRALPEGPHNVQASNELQRLRAAQRAREEDLAQTTADVEERLGHAAAERFRVRSDLAAWIERFLDKTVWAAPLSQAKAGLIVPWSLSLPAPRCASIELSHDGAASGPKPRAPSEPSKGRAGAMRCAKLVELPYTVTLEGSSSEAREATIEIAVVEDGFGRPLEVTIGGPDLFVRLEETHAVRAIKPGETDRRFAAIARAVELARQVFARAVSKEPSCKRGPTAPVVLEMGCSGMGMRVRPAVAAGDDDVVVIAPE